MRIPLRPVVLTGASGALGRELARRLGEAGWPLVLTDIVPFPDPLPRAARFIVADLEDSAAIFSLCEGAGTILHFGGASVERPFEEVVGPNIRGLYHVYEAAQRERARVVFASSNHVIGLHERTTPLDADCAYRPDGQYGLSKAFGELMARLYFDKHGVESVILRIGSCFPEPRDARMLATWLSYADLVRLVMCAALAERVGFATVWGASANARSFWRRDDRAVIGWQPQDSADPFIPALENRVSDNPVAERYQGGTFCAIDYTRDRG